VDCVKSILCAGCRIRAEEKQFASGLSQKVCGVGLCQGKKLS
jgi:hypothetical protein